MRKILFTALLALSTTCGFAQNSSVEYTEQDGAPSVYNPYQIRVTNGSLTNNNDGTISINTSGSNSSGWTDDGSVVRLTTASDNVGIGTTNGDFKLHILDTASNTNASAGHQTMFLNYSPAGFVDNTGLNYTPLAISVTPTSGVSGSGQPNLIGLSIGLDPNSSDTSDVSYIAQVLRLTDTDGSAIKLGTMYSGAYDYQIASTNNFRIVTVGGSGPNPELFMSATDGNIGLGITAPKQYLDVNGNANFDGKVGIGYTSIVDQLTVRQTTTSTSGNYSALHADIIHNAASDGGTENTAGLAFTATAAGTHTHNLIYGVSGTVFNTGTNTVTTAAGAQFLIENDGTGTISSAVGANIAPIITSSGNITNAIGLQIASPTYTSTGKITALNVGAYIYNLGNSSTSNSAALYIANQTGSSGLNAAVLTEGGLSWFNYTQTSTANLQVSTTGDLNALFVKGSTNNVGIGTSAPSAKLEVNGTIKAGNGSTGHATCWNGTSLSYCTSAVASDGTCTCN